MTDKLQGLSIYLRNIDNDTKAGEFAARAKAMGLSWCAIAGIWQEPNKERPRLINTGRMNRVSECRDFSRALIDVGITPFIWGYPWQGVESAFLEGMLEMADTHGNILLDPELGSNPTRDDSETGQARADQHARMLVRGFRAGGARRVGLSTYGVPPKWFPLDAFLEEEIDFAGGQTYTDDANVDRSIALFMRAIAKSQRQIQLVPNYGTYSWHMVKGQRRARSKTVDEQRSHLMEFIDDGEPVEAMIGWAENFLTPGLERELFKFSKLMERGACALSAK